MSYDLSLSIPAWPDRVSTSWIEELRLMGIELETPPALTLSTASGWLPVSVTIMRTSAIPYAHEFRALGTFESGFELYSEPGHAMFSAKSSDGNAVAVWCAAALAAVTHATLTDPQVGIKASGATGVEILAKLMCKVSFVESFCGPALMAALPPLQHDKVQIASVAIDPTKPPRSYAASSRYEVGDRVTHPTFGEGVVEISEPGKVTVFFAGGRRVLVQRKDAKSESLTRPARIDHSRPTPGGKPSH